jgi:hypothetical protein
VRPGGELSADLRRPSAGLPGWPFPDSSAGRAPGSWHRDEAGPDRRNAYRGVRKSG